VSLFITDLAFVDPILQADAKLGILLASITAAALGAAIILTSTRRQRVDGRPPDDGRATRSRPLAASPIGRQRVPPHAEGTGP
jgi:hypothetical protein